MPELKPGHTCEGKMKKKVDSGRQLESRSPCTGTLGLVSGTEAKSSLFAQSVSKYGIIRTISKKKTKFNSLNLTEIMYLKILI